MKKEKPTETKTFKVIFPVAVKVALNVLAATKRIAQYVYLSELVAIAQRYFETYGVHIIDDPFLNPAPPIAQVLENIDLQSLVEDVQIPMARLERIVAGDRPTDSDLSFLAASDNIPYSLEQLFQGRKLQFDRPEVNNAIK